MLGYEQNHAHQIQGTCNWEVKAVIRCLILDDGVVSVDGVCGEIDPIRWSSNQIQILADHRLASCLQC